MIYSHKFLVPRSFPSAISSGFGTKFVSENDVQSPHISMNQIHSTNVVHIEDLLLEPVEDADGTYSKNKDVSLIVRTADCVPILFYDEETELIGASHQGWKGSLERLQQKMIEIFMSNGAKAENIKVAIGPCIGACCYEIFGDRKKLFEKEFPTYINSIFVKNNEKSMLSLTRLNYELLLQSGVLASNIEYSLECTSCHDSLFSSYNKNKEVRSMYSFIRKN